MPMILKPIAVAVTLATTLPVMAHAQAKWTEIDDKTVVAPFNVDADRLGDMDVHNAAGQKIGEVEDVIGTDQSTASALVVDFDDDAGYGDRDDVIVPLDRFSLNGLKLVLEDDPAAIAGYETYGD